MTLFTGLGMPVTQGRGPVDFYPPNPASISPTSGSWAAASGIEITGTNFVDGCTVTIGGVECTVTFNDSTSLTVDLDGPFTADGVYAVVVTNPDTHTGAIPNAYTVALDVLADFAPRLWLKGDAGVTQAGGVVSAWADQSGNGRNVSQGSAGNRPAYVASAIGGMPAVSFDGVDDAMANTTVNCLASAGSAHSVFVVGKLDGTPASGLGVLFCERLDGQTSVSELRQVPDMIIHADEVNAGANCTLSEEDSETVATAIQSDFWSLHKMAGAGNAPTLYINGDAYEMDAGVQGTENGTTGFRIGGSAVGIYWKGPIAELMVLDGSVSDDVLTMLAAYAADRYGL